MAAWAYWLEAFQRLSDDYSISLKRSTELVQKALSLEDTTGLPHIMMGQIHLLKREYDQAIAEAEQAVLARPSCHGAYAIKANILNYLDRSAEAIELAKTAIRHTPAHPTLYPAILASAYYGCDRHEEAIIEAEEVITRDRDNLDALLILSGANVALGRIEEAHKATQEVLRVKPIFSLKEFAKSQLYKNPRTLEKVVSMLQKAGLK
jgi:adenylate cyclase